MPPFAADPGRLEDSAHGTSGADLAHRSGGALLFRAARGLSGDAAVEWCCWLLGAVGATGWVLTILVVGDFIHSQTSRVHSMHGISTLI